MRERFISLLDKLNAQEELSGINYTKLRWEYSEPQRYYHNIKHIKQCLVELDSIKHLMQEPNLVELAVWYHDVIYYPKAKDNEDKSAQLAYDTCLEAKLSESIATRVKELVLYTKHHSSEEINDMDAKYLMDIDLAILGKSQLEFDTYEKNIRKEYSHFSEEEYRKGRKIVLQKFLNRTHIYSTDFFRNKYELQARENLQRSIDALR